MTLSGVRIAEPAAKDAIGALFGISITSAVAGIAIKVQRERRLAINDVSVIVVSLCLCAPAILHYRGISAMYMGQEPPSSPAVVEPPPDLPMWLQRVLAANKCLMLTAIFSVKISFLFFFKTLVRRLQIVNIYWWCVISITAIVFAFAICDSFIACPYFELSRSQCHNAVEATKRLKFSVGILGLDILTDMMIMAILICVLGQLKPQRYQKLGLSIFGCLNFCMIVAAIMRCPSLRLAHPYTDMVWEVFWHFVEACLALMTVSVNAIRPLFVSDDLKVLHQREGPACSSSEWFRNSKNCLHSIHEMDYLPSVPTAALTGIRTWIRRDSKIPAMTSESDGDLISRWLLPNNTSRIMVTHEISTKAELIR